MILICDTFFYTTTVCYNNCQRNPSSVIIKLRPHPMIKYIENLIILKSMGSRFQSTAASTICYHAYTAARAIVQRLHGVSN